jgi:hypothetical protein
LKRRPLQISLAGMGLLAAVPIAILVGASGAHTAPNQLRLSDVGNSGTQQCDVTEFRSSNDHWTEYTEACSLIPPYVKDGPCTYIWYVLPGREGPYGNTGNCTHV